MYRLLAVMFVTLCAVGASRGFGARNYKQMVMINKARKGLDKDQSPVIHLKKRSIGRSSNDAHANRKFFTNNGELADEAAASNKSPVRSKRMPEEANLAAAAAISENKEVETRSQGNTKDTKYMSKVPERNPALFGDSDDSIANILAGLRNMEEEEEEEEDDQAPPVVDVTEDGGNSLMSMIMGMLGGGGGGGGNDNDNDDDDDDDADVDGDNIDDLLSALQGALYSADQQEQGDMMQSLIESLQMVNKRRKRRSTDDDEAAMSANHIAGHYSPIGAAAMADDNKAMEEEKYERRRKRSPSRVNPYAVRHGRALRKPITVL